MEVVVLTDLDDPLVPAIRAHDGLVNGERVEEFVGENDRGTIGDVLDRAMPERRYVGCGQRLALEALERRTDLDHVQHDGGTELRHHLGGPQCIEHHRAATGAELDQLDTLRRPHRPPDRRCPQPDQLAEHLADLRSGGEIARGSERIVRRVVAMLGMGEAERHVLRDRHRAAALDAPANLRRERYDVFRHHVGFRCWLRMAAAIRATPASSKGTDSSVPMVSPPHRNPSCGSGSRNSSQIARATP